MSDKLSSEELNQRMIEGIISGDIPLEKLIDAIEGPDYCPNCGEQL